MKKPVYTLELKSRKTLNKPKDYLAAVKLHCEMLPQYMPMKFDWVEPLKQIFKPKNLSNLVFANGNVDNIWWKRTEKPKANGCWICAGGYKKHSNISLNVLDTLYQDDLIEYLKTACGKNECDIGLLDSMASEYKGLAMLNKYAPFGTQLMLSTKCLKNWLPEMPWAVVFGSAYIRMFGKEKVLSTPAYKVQDIGDEMVYIQLTKNMSDIHEKYDEVMDARVAAKKHLGNDCFYDIPLDYDFNVEVEKAGKIYRVPEFTLEIDS